MHTSSFSMGMGIHCRPLILCMNTLLSIFLTFLNWMNDVGMSACRHVVICKYIYQELGIYISYILNIYFVYMKYIYNLYKCNIYIYVINIKYIRNIYNIFWYIFFTVIFFPHSSWHMALVIDILLTTRRVLI